MSATKKLIEEARVERLSQISRIDSLISGIDGSLSNVSKGTADLSKDMAELKDILKRIERDFNWMKKFLRY